MSSLRENWLSKVGLPFLIHRSFSWIVLAVHAGLLLKLRKTAVANRFSLALFLLILCTIASGVGMAWFDIPPVLQPVHLLLATITIGLQFLFLLGVRVPKNVTVRT
jgi:cytochrome c oxidase assembly protein subunit 15